MGEEGQAGNAARKRAVGTDVRQAARRQQQVAPFVRNRRCQPASSTGTGAHGRGACQTHRAALCGLTRVALINSGVISCSAALEAARAAVSACGGRQAGGSASARVWAAGHRSGQVDEVREHLPVMTPFSGMRRRQVACCCGTAAPRLFDWWYCSSQPTGALTLFEGRKAVPEKSSPRDATMSSNCSSSAGEGGRTQQCEGVGGTDTGGRDRRSGSQRQVQYQVPSKVPIRSGSGAAACSAPTLTYLTSGRQQRRELGGASDCVDHRCLGAGKRQNQQHGDALNVLHRGEGLQGGRGIAEGLNRCMRS